MGFTRKLMQAYFNYAYNPVYDFTTARLNRYRKLQRTCVDKLELKDSDKVLCVGLGTGNEVLHILQANRNANIIGVDYSQTALQKAYKKALMWGKEIETINMDVQRLEFPTGSFDKVLCVHVMDFIKDTRRATREILSVLRDQGEFVITYPSGKEGVKLGMDLLRDSIRDKVDSGRNRVTALLESLAQILVGIVYLPLLFRPNKKLYSRLELEAMITELNPRDFYIEEENAYHDFIVYGKK